MNAKEFAIKIEESELFDYGGDKQEVLDAERSPFDWLATCRPEIWEWVKLKVECGASDLTKEEYNKWIIDFLDDSSGFFKKKTRQDAIEEAKEGGYLIK